MRAVTLLILVALSLLASAQTPQPAQKKSKTLVDYQSELGLSDTQVADVKRTLELFKSEIKAYQSQLLETEQSLAARVKAGGSIEEIKADLRQSSDLHFQLRYLDVVTSRKVEAILSPDQMARWREIQQKKRGQAP
jgi:Spy/CpxP family protein refolding chaperone